MFRFGIEHEVAFLDGEGQFIDFFSASFASLQKLIDELPLYPGDEKDLRIGDAGIRVKRWYLEVFERFNERGDLTNFLPKGIEIRTTIHSSIGEAINELSVSFQRLQEVAHNHGLVPVLTSHHPYRTTFVIPDPPMNDYELQVLHLSPEDESALLSMVTYGPDLNFSVEGLSVEALVDLGRKLTYYSPFIIPWSFSSPFYNGHLWDGFSARTFNRTGPRPAVQVFLGEQKDLIPSIPSLTKPARSQSEVGRIEFKAFDSCDDFSLYAALMTLLKGLTLDKTLPGRALVPDKELHQRSALCAFGQEDLFAGAQAALKAAAAALDNDPDIRYLEPLYYLLHHKITPAHLQRQAFLATNSIEEVLRATYQETQPWRHKS